MTSKTLDRLNHAKLVERYVVTTRQRDDLLAALKAVVEDANSIECRDIRSAGILGNLTKTARAALAKAKEE